MLICRGAFDDVKEGKSPSYWLYDLGKAISFLFSFVE